MHGNEVLGFVRPEVFFCPPLLIWNHGVFSPTLKKFPLALRVSFGLPFTVNSQLLRYFLVQTLSQKHLTWHQIRLKRRDIMKRKQNVQSFLSVWNKRLLSATASHAWHAGKRPSQQFAVTGSFLQTMQRRIE